MNTGTDLYLLAGGGLLAGLAIAGLAWLLLQYRRQHHRLRRAQQQLEQLRLRHQKLQQKHSALHTLNSEQARHHQQQLNNIEDHKARLRQEFENLANRIFEHRSEQFSQHSRHSLDVLLKPFREQVQHFQQRAEQIHSESLKSQNSLEGELCKVLDVGLQMNEQAASLAAALNGDNKQAGNWGEAQLERTLQLSGLRPQEHYQMQATLRDASGNRRLPDCLLLLPDNKHLIIDSKVSLNDYQRAVTACEEEEYHLAVSAHMRSVRRHIDDLANKDYFNLGQLDSPDFVLMFMPVEAAYIETLKTDGKLFDEAYRRGVVLVSHTTLMPVLRTAANLWMADRSSREAREISKRAGEIYNQASLIGERLHRLGNSLRTASGHYNDSVRALAGKQGLYSKIERFTQFSAHANRSMPTIEPLVDTLDQARLQASEANAATHKQNPSGND